MKDAATHLKPSKVTSVRESLVTYPANARGSYEHSQFIVTINTPLSRTFGHHGHNNTHIIPMGYRFHISFRALEFMQG
ncbi:unnamed protein product [Arctia plantaginis]|uniref:Uncharacterized protein n=1 Tax=Arctia plantaginis TaxID=874455 RepID=A0A8S1BGR8_ARCPL|nr:unnamed protein product [Arctia plantaginis]